ncbi:MAG: 30S ribosome-binding factor RbfA [Gammaproteobacteria bacterium]
MPREFHRSSRVAQAIHRVLAELFGRQARDERLQQVTVTHVDVSRDLGVAKIHYTVRDAEYHDDVAEALTSSTGFLRREVAHQVRLRTTPQLRFMRDESLERGERLTALIDEARARDRDGSDTGEH